MGGCAAKEGEIRAGRQKSTNWGIDDEPELEDDPSQQKRKSRAKGLIKQDTVATFIPGTIKKFAVEYDGEWKSPMKQSFDYREKRQAVALFADVSGFTAMTEALAKEGPAIGAQKLAEKLNDYLSILVKRVTGSGGDIFKFAGDALIALWPVEGKDLPQLEHNLQETVHKVVDCCCRMQLDLNGDPEIAKNEPYNMKPPRLQGADGKPGRTYEGVLMTAPTDPNPITLLVKFGVGVGDATVIHVGGIKFLNESRMEYLPIGPALNQAYDCEADAKGGHTIVSADVYQELQKVNQRLAAEQMNDIQEDGEALRIEGKGVGNIGNYRIWAIRPARKKKPPNIRMTAEAQERIKCYIPRALMPHLKIGQQLWAGELRYLTVMFLSLGVDLNVSRVTDEILERVNVVLKVVQESIYVYEGSLNKFLSDDKGSTVMILFGLSPVAHEDDPIRAVLAALRMDQALKKLEKPCHCAVGIASGVVFSGPVGSAGTRREYTVLGDRANLAARLMAHGKYKWNKEGTTADTLYKGPNITVDQGVWEVACKSQRIAWEDLGTINVKGKKDLIHIHTPSLVSKDFSYSAPTSPLFSPTASKKGSREPRASVGLAKGGKDWIQTRQLLTKFSATGAAAIVLIENQMGMAGKQRVLRDIANSPEFGALAKFWGKGDPFDPQDCYNIWPSILKGFRQGGEQNLLEGFEAHIAETAPHLVTLCDSHSNLLGQDREDEKDGAELQELVVDADSQSNVPELLTAALTYAARDNKFIIALEDTHCLSNPDWLVAYDLMTKIAAGSIQNVAVLASSKPISMKVYRSHTISDKRYKEYQTVRAAIKASDGGLIFHREPWAPQRAKDYLLEKLQESFFEIGLAVSEIGPYVHEVIYERTGGRPGFIEEFVECLIRTEIGGLPDGTGKKKMLMTKKTQDGTQSKFADLIEQALTEGHVTVKVAVEKRQKEGETEKLVGDLAFPIPPTIESSCIAALDTLNPEHGLVLKVAASLCIGYGNGVLRFGRRTLEGAHPVEQYKSSTNKCLIDLVDWGFLNSVKEKDAKGFGVMGFKEDEDLKAEKPLLGFYEAQKQLIQSGKLKVSSKGTVKKSAKEYTCFFCKDGVLYWFNEKLGTNQGSEGDWYESYCNITDVQAIEIQEKNEKCLLQFPKRTITLQSKKKGGIVSWATPLQEEHQRVAGMKGQDELERQASVVDFADAQIRSAFNAVDEDGDGTLDRDEFKVVLENMNMTAEDKQVDEIFNSIDQDADHCVTYKEFATWVKNGRHKLAHKLVSSQKEGPFYEFAFGFMRDVCYKKMLFKQRAFIHGKAKRYFCDKQKEIWNQIRSLDKNLQQVSLRHAQCVTRCKEGRHFLTKVDKLLAMDTGEMAGTVG